MSSDPFADVDARARQRRRVVVVVALGSVAFVTLAIVLLHLYFDGERQVRMHARTIEPVRARYCAVLAAEETRSSATPRVAATERLVHLGGLDVGGDGDASGIAKSGNADAIEIRELRDACAGRAGESSPAFHSEIATLFVPESRRSRSYDGVGLLLETLPRVEYLVVLSLDGQDMGRVSAYRLADAAWLGSAYVVVDPSRPAPRPDSGFATETALAMRARAIEGLRAVGVDVTWE